MSEQALGGRCADGLYRRFCLSATQEDLPEDLRKLFSKFSYKIFIIVLLNIIGLENFPLSFSKSQLRITMCNLHCCYTFCTGVALELQCSQHHDQDG